MGIEGREQYPSLDYVNSFFDTTTSVADSEFSISTWRRNDRKEYTFDSLEEATKRKDELASKYGNDAVLMWDTKDGKIHVKVPRPILESEGRNFSFNREQKHAIATIADWLMDRAAGIVRENWIVLEGEAGTGKTSIISDILLNAPTLYHGTVVTGAVSNKATDNIISKLSPQIDDLFNVDRKTVAGMLGLKETYADDGGVSFEDVGGEKALFSAQVAIIDEASMITEQVLEYIKEASESNIPILFIGDAAQIYPVRSGQYYTAHPEINKNADSPVFQTEGKKNSVTISLKERVRQGEDSPILDFTHKYREAWAGRAPLPNVRAEKSSADGRLIYTSKNKNDLLKDLLPVFAEAVRTGNHNLIHIVPFNVDYKTERITLLDQNGNVLYTKSGKPRTYIAPVKVQPGSALWWNQRIYDLLHPEMAGQYSFQKGDLLRFDDSYAFDENTIINNSTEAVAIVSKDLQTDEYGIKYRFVTLKLSSGNVVSVPVIEQTMENIALYSKTVGLLWSRIRSKDDINTVKEYQKRYAKVTLNYALNVHKAQGSTYDITVFDKDNMDGAPTKVQREKASLSYTAATRAKNILLVSSAQASESDMRVNLLATNKLFNEARSKKPVTIAKGDSTEENKQLNDRQPVIPAPAGTPIDVVFKNKDPKISSLSNLATREFTPGTPERNYNTGNTVPYNYHRASVIFTGGRKFKTVEGAFQAAKMAYAIGYIDAKGNRVEYIDANGNITEEGKIALDIFQNGTGNVARTTGKTLKGLDTVAWDRDSSDIMYNLLKESFLQNDEARKNLIDTGTEPLVHSIPDSGKSDFIGNLSQLRSEFRSQVQDVIDIDQDSPFGKIVFKAMHTVLSKDAKSAEPNKGTLPKELTSVSEVLAAIANGTLDTNASREHRTLAAALIPLAERLGGKINFDEFKGHFAGRTYEKTTAEGSNISINTRTQKIGVYPSRTILHEVTHLLTKAILDNDRVLRSGIDELKNYVIDYIKDEVSEGKRKTKDYTFYSDERSEYIRHTLNFDIYGLSNAGEFFAEAIGNPNFQEVLKTIPAPRRKNLSVWDRIVSFVTDAFTRLFRKEYKTEDTVYDQLKPVIAYVMEAGSYSTDIATGTIKPNSTTLSDTQLQEAADTFQLRSPEAFAGVSESQSTINSGKTILSNEELKYWNEKGVGDNPRILVGSEHSDPAFHTREILDVLNGKRSVRGLIPINKDVWETLPASERRQSTKNGVTTYFRLGDPVTGKDFAGLYLITKHDGLPMLELLETKIPKLVHFSITTLGGTEYEPGVMKYNDLLDRIEEYLKQGLDPNSVTIRVDPIVPGITQFADIREVVRRASAMGIKRIRFSVMDAYDNTVAEMSKHGYDFQKYYGISPVTGKPSFMAKQEELAKIYDFMLSLKDEFDITLGTCAEVGGREGISKEGCLSVSAVNQMLGTNIEDLGTGNNNFRKLCSCYGGKIDALAYGDNCASHCVYCYAKHANDKALQYYNPDGTLKDNNFTRARRQEAVEALRGGDGIASYRLHSGGAEGADTLWDTVAANLGMPAANRSHYFYHTKTPIGNVALTEEQYKEGVQHAMKANQVLGRKGIEKPENMRTIARNWFQVKNSDAVFAIAPIDLFGNISGGTAWAVQMAIDEGKPVYVYDGMWYTYNRQTMQFEPYNDIPILTKNFAGIGSRSIKGHEDEYRPVIEAVFHKTLLQSSVNGIKDSSRPAESNEKPVTYMMSVQQLDAQDSQKYTGGITFTPLLDFKDKEIVDSLKDDVVSGKLPVGTKITIEPRGTVSGIIASYKILKKAPYIYQGSSIPVDASQFSENELQRMTSEGIQNDGKQVYIPTFSVGLSEKELSDIAKRDRITKYKLLTPSEIRAVGVRSMWKVSDIVSKLQTGGVQASRELLKDIDGLSEKDFTGMSRLEILTELGSRIFDVVRDTLFAVQPSDKPKDVAKKQFIKNNFDIICELAQDFLADNESVTLKGTSVNKTIIGQDYNGVLSEALNSDDAQEILEKVGSIAEHWQIGFRQVSAVSSLSAMVRRTLSSLIELDAEGNVIQEQYGPKLLNTHTAILDMLKWVSGAKTSDEMVERLKSHLPGNPWLAQLVGEYHEDGDPNKPIKSGILVNPDNSQLKTRFFTNFSKYFQSYIVMYKGDSGDTRIREINTKQFSESAISDLRAADSHKELGHLLIWNKEGGLSDAFFELSRIVGTSGYIDKKTKERFEPTGLQAVGDTLTTKNLEDFKKALSLLNISVPSVEELATVFTNGNIEDFKDAVTKLRYIVSAIKNRARAWEENPANEFTLFGKDNSIKNNLESILGKLSPILHTNTEAVSYEAGKLHYGYVQPSYLNMHVSDLRGDNMNDEEYSRFLHDNFKVFDGWYYTSEGNDKLAGRGWLNEWMEILEGDKTLRSMFRHTASLAYDGTGYTDKINPQMGASLLMAYFYDKNDSYAYYRVLLLSNKPSEEYIRFVRFTKDYKKHITENVLMRTFMAEVNRIRTVNERLAKVERGELSKDVLIENLETKAKNGTKFYFLKFLNDEMENNTVLGQYVKRFIDGSLVNNPESSEYIDFMGVFRREFNRFMERRFNQFLDNLEQDGTIARSNGMITTVYGVQDKVGVGVRAQSNLEEFFWNDWYAQFNMQQILFGDPAQYVNAEDLQKRAAELHSPGMRPDISALDITRKTPVTDGMERFLVIDDIIKPSSAVIVLDKVHKKILSDPKFTKPDGTLTPLGEKKSALLKKVRDMFAETNVTDGQAFISPTGLRKIMHMFGKWDLHMEDLYNRLMNGEDVSNKEFDVIWSVIKPFSYSLISKGTKTDWMPYFNVGIQQKNSMYPIILAAALSRSVGEDNMFTALYDVMESTANKGENNDGIDGILFASNLKTGKSGSTDISSMTPDEIRKTLKSRIQQVAGQKDAQGKQRLYNEDYVYEVPWSDWAQQQEVPNHFEGTQQKGSQQRGLVVADVPTTHVDADGNVVDNKVTINLLGKDTNMTVADAKKMYFEANAANINMSAQDLAEELALDVSNKKLRNIALSRVLTEQLQRDGRFGFDMMKAISVDKDGEFIAPLSDPMLAGVIQQMLNSIIKNRVYKQQIAGGPLVQVSSIGFETNRELNIVYNKDHTRPLYAEVMISAPEEFYQHKEFLDENGELSIALIEKYCPKALEMIGYRIPTEAKYSMLAMKVVGFLPRGTEGIMLPKEITTLSGSDFDVDKLYIMRQMFEKDKSGVFTTDVRNVRDKNNNISLDIAWAFLTSELTTDQTISAGQFDELKRVGYSIAATDNADTDNPSTYKKTLDKQSPSQLKDSAYKASDLLFADTQIKFFHQNMVAGKLIGVFAQANMSHAFVSMMRDAGVNPSIKVPESLTLRFRDTNNVKHTIGGETPIDMEYDWTGLKRISAAFAECIGASVDAVKDPVFNFINVNMITVNAFSTMMRFGVDSETLGWFLTTPIIKELVKRYEVLNAEGSVSIGQVIDALKNEITDGRPVTFDENYYWGLDDFVNYHFLPVSPQRRNEESDEEFLQRKTRTAQLNYQLLELFDRMQGLADITRSLVHITRINSISSAPGPFAANTFSDELKTERFFTNPALARVQGVADNPVIKSFLTNTGALVNHILGENLVQAGPIARALYERLENMYEYVNDSLLQSMSEFMTSYLINLVNPIFDLSYENRRHMLVAFPNLFKRIQSQYADNLLVSSINYDVTESKVPYLELKTKGLSDTDMAELSAAWDTLYREEEKRLASGQFTGLEAENLAIKLVEYNFFRGGFGFDPKTFTRIVPESIKDKLPYYRSNTKALMGINPDSVNFDNLIFQYMLNTGKTNMPLVDKLNIKKMEETGNLYVTKADGNAAKLKMRGIVGVRAGNKGISYYYVEYDPQLDIFNLTKVSKLGGKNLGFEIDPNTDFRNMKSGFEAPVTTQKGSDATPDDYVADLDAYFTETPEVTTTSQRLMDKVLGESWRDTYMADSKVDSYSAFKDMTDKFFFFRESGVEDITQNDNFVAQELSKVNFGLTKAETESMMARVIARLDEQNICR